jgi:hypothetical protein
MNSPARGTRPAPRGDRKVTKNNTLHTDRDYSALALFVAAILADDPDHTVAPNDLAVAADTLD